MTYTKEQFFDDVAKEATALKEHATKEEIYNLSSLRMDPKYYNTCIYGLMTGDCRSLRASELILLCCNRFIVNDDNNKLVEQGLRAVINQVNGEKIGDSAEEVKVNRGMRISHFSFIEAYILTPNAKNENLIAFLTGEKKKLVL